MSSKKEGKDVDLMAKATNAADDLYELRDTYFPADETEKVSVLRAAADCALGILYAIPSEQRKSPSHRANYEFLQGKILNVLPDYQKEAEDHLSKAVKLNPSFSDAWLCLGNFLWKKGDLLSAKNCYNLSLEKGPNKKILGDLSMLERLLAQDNLGNAYLTSFFLTGSWDHEKLSQSLKAYQNADKDEKMKSNPDLYFNYATVNKYLENYERALAGFEAAGMKDPNLSAKEEVEKLINLLDLFESVLMGVAKGKRLPAFASSLENVNLDSSHRKTTINRLSEGPNKEVAVVGKVLFFANQEKAVPLYYILCDSEKNCFVLSVYGIRAGAIKVGDRLALLEPNFHVVDFSWKNKIYYFKSIRVDFSEQVLVNEKPLAPHLAVRSSVLVEHKP